MDSEPGSYRVWKHGVLWLVAMGVVMARIPTFWLSGEFVAEDAWVFFPEAFNSSWTSSILTPYAGYFHLVPRILAEFLSIFPLVFQPYAYAFVGMGLNALFFSLFFLPHFRHVIASDNARAVVVIILALVPHSENMGFILGLHWYIAFLLPLLFIMEFPKSRQGKWSMYGCSVACLWSSPSNLVLAPFLLWDIKTGSDPNKRKWSQFTLLNLIVVAIFIILLRFRDAARTGEFLLSQIPHAIDRLVVRSWLGTSFVGQRIANHIVDIQPWLMDILGLSMAALIGWLLYRMRKHPLFFHAITLTACALFMIGLSMTRSLYIAELGQIELTRHVRYLTGPSVLIVLVLLCSLYHLAREKHIRLFYAACGLQALLLAFGTTAENHWARQPETFRIRDFADEISSFQNEYLKTGSPAVLYIPSEVPYWGPLLKSEEQLIEEPSTTLLQVPTITSRGETFKSWLGGLETKDKAQEYYHPKLGTLTFNGLAEGRIWFRDTEDRLLFTSELLSPYLWRMEGLHFELLKLE